MSIKQIKVTIDGNEVAFTHQQPRIVEGRTMVPIDVVLKHMGYSIEWERRGKYTISDLYPIGALKMTKGTTTVMVYEWTNYFSVNGERFNHTDNVAAMSVGNKLMVPVRGVLESIGCTVSWDEGDSESDIIGTVVVKTSLDGYYKIKTSNGKYITCGSPVISSNDPITIADSNGADTQIWKIERTAEGNAYHIRPALNDRLAMNVYRKDAYPCTVQPTYDNIADTSFKIESVPGYNYVISWQDSAGNVRYLTELDGVVNWMQSSTQQAWTLEAVSYTPPEVPYEITYPVAGITGVGRTYDGHALNSRDFSADAGTPIYATMAGTVIAVVMSFPNDYNYHPIKGVSTGGASASIDGKMASYGNYVKIQVDMDGSVLIYAHQQQNSYVQVGDVVSAGQQIGEVGNTGVSTGSHLHFQVNPVRTEGNDVFDYFRWE